MSGDSIVYSLSHPLDDNQPNQLPGLVALPGNYPPPYELVEFDKLFSRQYDTWKPKT